jgi:2-oxoglutarate dehydrogenase E2 component (dihydrolipoamide succinyltransferase)
MARMNIILPAMGEGVIEATINKWLVTEGSHVNEDDPLVEVATDKVDSEIPAPATGTLVSIIVKEGSVTRIGEILATIETNVSQTNEVSDKVEKEVERIRETIETVKNEKNETEVLSRDMKSRTPSGKFISPLVRSIAVRENISYSDLDKIVGTGMDGRITRDDILKLLENRRKIEEATKSEEAAGVIKMEKVPENQSHGDEVIPMDRVRRLIADHMVMSKRTSPHVTSFIEADVTRLVNWRNANKDKFLAAEGQKLTLTPIS